MAPQLIGTDSLATSPFLLSHKTALIFDSAAWKGLSRPRSHTAWKRYSMTFSTSPPILSSKMAESPSGCPPPMMKTLSSKSQAIHIWKSSVCAYSHLTNVSFHLKRNGIKYEGKCHLEAEPFGQVLTVAAGSRRLLTYRKLPVGEHSTSVPRRSKDARIGVSADELNAFRRKAGKKFH
jgi:hypothetical protein